ncbi:hypothetical protein L1F30_11510 [Simiduia sp. 21SJ11W-1]|uniref:ShlB/FhaC/HecB family hemolysin secretion/activation protein n=1 Tax=Simiduia sp. 21SJ11W-1 TaxID=2909669 RepID=UPI0020A0C59D|nr:ShlB/FhaC/HecB family hemolysin secretion/activation protein [Simiduia sp. 21SJ11W-1]UTA46786.1 hypothetical protein L1F30_11510 [Simiduia sp. 21SJ11W-1]
MFRQLWAYPFAILLSLPISAQAQTNIDPVAEQRTMVVKRLVISSSTGNFAQKYNTSELLAEANRLRSQYPEEMTFTQLSLIADQLTRALRDQGYKFHYVFLPRQTSRSGVVRLNLVEISLDDVTLLGEPGVDATSISSLFKRLLNRPLYQPEVDRILRNLNRQPEVSLFGYYSRGKSPNSIRLNLRATAQGHHRVSSSLDNYGSESSGHYRFTNYYTWLSPLGNFDRLDVGLMAATGGANNAFGYLAYQHPITGPQNGLAVSVTNNQFDVGQEFESLELSGDTLIAGARFFQRWSISDTHTHTLSLGWQDKSVDYSNVFNDDSLVNDETAQVASAGWQWAINAGAWAQSTGINGFQGQHQLTGALEFEQTFTYWAFYANSRWQLATQTLSADFHIQQADTLLPSFEKLALTGISGARGFYAGQFSADRGARAHLNWQTPLRWQIADFTSAIALFADAGLGEQLGPEGDVLEEMQLVSAGIEIQAQFKGLSASLQWSGVNQTTYSSPINPSAERELREIPVTFELNYRW